MPNWKKVITSGSNAELNNLYVTNDVTASIVSASTYYGDGSNLTGISFTPFPYTGDAVVTGSFTLTSPGNVAELVVQDGASGAPIRLVSQNSNESYIYLGPESSSLRRQAGILHLRGQGVPVHVYNSNSPTGMYINNSGDIGFLTTNPTGSFHVASGIRLDSNLTFTGRGFIRNNTNSMEFDLTDASEHFIFQNGLQISSSFNDVLSMRAANPSIQLDDTTRTWNIQAVQDSRLRIQNNGGESLSLTKDSKLGLSTTTPQYRLDVNGDARITNGLTVTGSNVVTGSMTIDGDTTITGSTVIESSGSTVFEVIGSVGSLFSIDDSLSGSLMSVSDISGIPQFEVFSDGQVTIGSTPTSLYTTAQIASTQAGVNESVYTLSTSSYDGAWFEYTAISASNLRAGSVMSVWEAGTSNISFTETTTRDLGDTTDVNISAVITGSLAALRVLTDTEGWKIKTIVRSI